MQPPPGAEPSPASVVPSLFVNIAVLACFVNSEERLYIIAVGVH